MDRPFQLVELLRRDLETKPDAATLISAESDRTWRELDRLSRRYAANLLWLEVSEASVLLEEIVVLEKMPLNSTGKVDRVTLKCMAEERMSGGTG